MTRQDYFAVADTRLLETWPETWIERIFKPSVASLNNNRACLPNAVHAYVSSNDRMIDEPQVGKDSKGKVVVYLNAVLLFVLRGRWKLQLDLLK